MKLLTDNCEKAFDKWYKVEFEKINLPYIQGFEISDLSIQWGVYLEFFESVELKVSVMHFPDGYYGYDIQEQSKEKSGWEWIILWEDERFKNRQEAQAAAIKKANELWNGLT